MANNLTPEEEKRLAELASNLRGNRATEFPFGPDAVKDLANRVMKAGSEIAAELAPANRHDYRLLLRQGDNSYLHRIAETGRSWSELGGGQDPGRFVIFISTYGSEIIRNLELPSSTDGQALMDVVTTKFAQKLGFLGNDEKLDPSNPKVTREVKYPQYADSEVELTVKHPSQPYIFTKFIDNDPLFVKTAPGGFAIGFDRQA